MRIVLTPFGSRGDVQPMLALALGLRARGHDVLLAAAPDYQPWVESLGLAFHPVGGDFQAWLARKGREIQSTTAALQALGQRLKEELPATFAQVQQALRGADLAITTIHTATRSVAEALGVPCRTLLYSPQVLHSRHHPPLSIPWMGLPGWLNLGLWWALGKAFDSIFKGPVNRERALLGLPPLRSYIDYARGPNPVVASDPHFAALPPDVLPGAMQTGSLLLPEQDALEPELESFLQAGEPPLYIGFGSMPDVSPEATTRQVAEAVSNTGRRAILCSGWAGLGGSGLPRQILVIRAAPHGRLFPRVAAAVHHGGAGTSAAALHAGIPQVVVPHSADQFFHGHRVHALGLGPAPIRRNRLNSRTLTHALQQVLSTSSMAERARALAGQLRAQDGVRAAVEALLPSA